VVRFEAVFACFVGWTKDIGIGADGPPRSAANVASTADIRAIARLYSTPLVSARKKAKVGNVCVAPMQCRSHPFGISDTTRELLAAMQNALEHHATPQRVVLTQKT
jgi:hypothetical protein